MLYCHGGGFRLGSPQGIAGFAAQVAQQTGTRMVLPAYRLAPEHPFPCALHDVRSVANALGSVDPIRMGGDSAGGNLALVITALRPEIVDRLLLLSPWLDLTLGGKTFETHASRDKLFSRAAAEDARGSYLQGARQDHPMVSPVTGSIAALPPTCVIAGGEEVLLDDSLIFSAQQALAGSRISLHVIPAMQHVAVTLDPTWPGAKEAMELLVAFLCTDRYDAPQARLGSSDLPGT
jgi:acetyl esterase/lipase